MYRVCRPCAEKFSTGASAGSESVADSDGRTDRPMCVDAVERMYQPALSGNRPAAHSSRNSQHSVLLCGHSPKSYLGPYRGCERCDILIIKDLNISKSHQTRKLPGSRSVFSLLPGGLIGMLRMPYCLYVAAALLLAPSLSR